MKKNEKVRQRLRANIALIEAQLTRYKVRGMGFTGEAKDRHDGHIEELEQKIDGINEKLSYFAKTDEHLWENLTENIEWSLKELQAVFLDATQTFKTEPGATDLHGNDTGPFPYGEGLSGRSADKKTAPKQEQNYGRQKR